MAFSITNIGTNGITASGSSITITSVTVPAGSLIVAIGAEGDTTTVGGTIKDGTNGSYTGPVASGNLGGSSGHGWSGLFYFPNSASLSGATITYTLAGALSSGLAATLSACYITGALAVSPLDTAVTATSSSGGTSPSVTSGVPSAADMLVAWAAINNNTTYNQDSTHSWVAPPTAVQAPSSGHMSFGGGSQVASVATQFSPTFNTGSTSWAAVVGFKPAAVAQNPFVQTDWPTPAPAPFPIQLRSWMAFYNPNLIGRDQLPFRQQDWPLPGRPDGFAQWRTWTWSYNQNLIGQDALPFRQQDWPNPTPPNREPSLRSWVWNYNPNLIGRDALPFRQQDWPVPTAAAYSIQLRTWTWTVLPLLPPNVGTPLGPFDWPLPIQPTFPIGLRSWAWSYNPNLIGKDSLPFRQQDWPLPATRRGSVADAQPNLLLTTLAQVQRPFVQTDWPVPAGYPYPVSLRESFGQLLPSGATVQLHDSPFVFGHVGRLMIH